MYIYGKIPWRRERLSILVFWPGELQGLYSLWGRKELDTTELLSLSLPTLPDTEETRAEAGAISAAEGGESTFKGVGMVLFPISVSLLRNRCCLWETELTCFRKSKPDGPRQAPGWWAQRSPALHHPSPGIRH